MTVELGFIYGLKNPITGEMFYIGSTQSALKHRLKRHYQDLKEVKTEKRKLNKRYSYLIKLLPLKAEIFLLEIVQNGDLDDREIFYIKHFKNINPNLTNMTTGGRGGYTCQFYTEKEMEEYSKKISNSNKGKPKPKGFAENMSLNRRGLNNPAIRPLAIGKIVCFKDGLPIKMFIYGFEISQFVNSKHGASSVMGMIRLKKYHWKPYGYEFKKFDDCTKEVQDIVQSDYENSQQNQAGFEL